MEDETLTTRSWDVSHVTAEFVFLARIFCVPKRRNFEFCRKIVRFVCCLIRLPFMIKKNVRLIKRAAFT